MSGLMLSKLMTQLLLPPGGLLLLAFAGFLARRKGWGRMLLVFSLSALWLLSTEPVRDALTGPLEFQSPPLLPSLVTELRRSPPGTTAIVVLGGGIREQAPEYGGSNELGAGSMMRTVYAAGLARQTGLPLYAAGGQPLGAAESEGAIMRRWLAQFGVAGEHIFTEQASKNTWQNALYVQRILRMKGMTRVVLVTSAWHMPRARWCFEQQGLEVIGAPTDYLTKQNSYDARSLLPDAGVLDESSRALHEYIGIAWYRLRYG